MDQSARGPNPVDVHVGGRLRLRRTLLGMTQTSLGEAIGLTFQQVQKYERGMNRIGSSRLYDLARVLDVPINFFFEEMPAGVASKSPAQMRGLAEPIDTFEPDIAAKRETLELVRAYYKISNPHLRKRLFEMVKALGAASEGQK
jgi:transcriptional regulator with XRE-family HTH domain